MNNRDCIVHTLAAHREARQWDDTAVANDLIAQLGLDAEGNASNAKPAPSQLITQDEVDAAEAIARHFEDKAQEKRDALKAQAQTKGTDDPDAQRGGAPNTGTGTRDPKAGASAVAAAAEADAARVPGPRARAPAAPPIPPGQGE